MKHLTLKVTGHVQDVNFRANTEDFAKRKDLKGFVRNEPDGSVLIQAEGEDGSIRELLDWLENSPGNSWVSRIDTEEGELRDYENFEIRR